MARRRDLERRLPPAPAPERPCSYGAHPSTGWRWFSGLASWERMCLRHVTSDAMRRGDYIPDVQSTERQDETA